MPRRRKKPKLEETAEQGDPACQIDRSSGSGAAAPPVYLLVGHGSISPAYSVFKVDPYAGGGKGAPGRPLARLKCKHGKSFVLVRSKHGAWIVGAGGLSTKSRGGTETIVFDTESHEVITGPNPGSTKRNPVLLAVGEKIYAMTQYPSMNGRVDDAYNGRINFLPWFEVLDLSQAKVVGGCLTGCEWKPLPRPPFFPWRQNLYQYICRTTRDDFSVRSYASVGCYILVSSVGQPGTYAFDTETEKWTTVDEKNDLPFIEGAIPHGPKLFLGVSRATRAITAYKINVIAGVSLSITKIPVSYDLLGDEEVMPPDKFLSLGIDRGFCSVKSWSVDESWDPPFFREHIKVIAYGTEDFEGKWLDVSKRWKQLYKLHDSVRTLDRPCVAGLSSI